MSDAPQPIDLQEIPAEQETGPALFVGNFDLIKGVEVALSVVVGRSRITVEELFALKEGSAIALDSLVDDPIELHLDSKLIGRGELVAVGDNFGIRVTEISPVTR